MISCRTAVTVLVFTSTRAYKKGAKRREGGTIRKILDLSTNKFAKVASGGAGPGRPEVEPNINDTEAKGPSRTSKFLCIHDVHWLVQHSCLAVQPAI